MASIQRFNHMPSASRAGLLDQFSRHLDAELAVNASQRDEAYRLRYDVYCEERGYEDAARFPNRMEMDEYDHNSIHALVRHRSSDLVAGVVRLVFADESDPHKPLPIEYYCGDHFDRSVLERYDFSRAEVAEVSRFAVSNRFVNSAAPAGDVSPQGDVHGRHRFQDDPSQYLPHISLGLIAMLFVASAQHRISHWYAIMEPSLNRLLGRSGIEFNAIGPIMNYHGRRQPMIASVNELLSDIYEKRYEFFRLIEHLGGVPADFTPDRRVAQAGPSRRLFSVS